MTASHTPLTSHVCETAHEHTAPALNDIQWNSSRHLIIVNRLVVRLTPVEYRLLLPLRDGAAITYEQLSHTVYGGKSTKSTRSVIDKHIDRIRGKVRDCGLYVYCIIGYGYILAPRPQER